MFLFKQSQQQHVHQCVQHIFRHDRALQQPVQLVRASFHHGTGQHRGQLLRYQFQQPFLRQSTVHCCLVGRVPERKKERHTETQKDRDTEEQNRKQRKRPKKEGVVLDTDQITIAVADSSLTPLRLPPIPHWATTTPSTIQRCNRLCPPRKLLNIRNKYRRKKGQKFNRSIPTMYRHKLGKHVCMETTYGKTMYENNVWKQCMETVYGNNVWKQCMETMYGKRKRKKLLTRTRGFTFFQRCVDFLGHGRSHKDREDTDCTVNDTAAHHVQFIDACTEIIFRKESVHDAHSPHSSHPPHSPHSPHSQ